MGGSYPYDFLKWMEWCYLMDELLRKARFVCVRWEMDESGIEEEGGEEEPQLNPDDLIIPEIKYEYLDHPADVQLHAWGDNLLEAFEQCAMSMFGYMTTEIESVEMTDVQHIEAEGHDMESLLYQFLDEFLFLFSAEPFFIARKVVILDFDVDNFKIRARGYGETFTLGKHPQGTEVKAITYGSMQIYDNPHQHEVFVIIDIWIVMTATITGTDWCPMSNDIAWINNYYLHIAGFIFLSLFIT